MSATELEPDVPKTAAEWFAARLGPRRDLLEPAFAEWLDAQPDNRRAYTACELAWRLTAGDSVQKTSLRPHARRRRLAALAMAASLAAVATGTWVMLSPPPPLTYRTTAGEQRIIQLTDGSRVTLNTRSQLEVRIDRRHRDLRLVAGEAFFEVAKDASRPFIVATPVGSARAVGTRFNVLVDRDRVDVSTEEGRVLVTPSVENAPGVLATAGVRATLERGIAQPALGRADLNRIDNWRVQRLEFDRVPLSEVLAEFSRYTPLPIRASTPAIGQVTVSAVLKIGDIEALKATLDAAFGLDVVPQASEWVVTRR